MSSELEILMITAISVSFLHTLMGPDHYLPFIALSKARGWSFGRTIFWTVICGCGHVWSSVVLGLGGAAVGWSLSKIHWLQSIRGGIAGWTLLCFGFLYSLWGLIRVNQNRRHKHFDTDEEGAVYVYEHKHEEAVAPKERHPVTPWVMFIIFLLGPCEPMIPLLYFPGAKNSVYGIVVLVTVYTLFTLATMVLMVLLGYYGISFFETKKIERYMPVLGGVTIGVCGAGMVFMDW